MRLIGTPEPVRSDNRRLRTFAALTRPVVLGRVNGIGQASTACVWASNAHELLKSEAVARISPMGWFSATRQVEVVRRLVEADAPVAGLDPRVEPRVVTRDGFEIAMWAYVEPTPFRELPPDEYARTLERLHSALRQIDIAAPHVTEHLAEIREWLGDADATPDLFDEDRDLIVQRLEPPARLLVKNVDEQLLHGEPHPWNLLTTGSGLRFIDFENCARGPVEYDLAWVPRVVSENCRDADHELVDDYRRVVLALVAAHRWHRNDRHPVEGSRRGVPRRFAGRFAMAGTRRRALVTGATECPQRLPEDRVHHRGTCTRRSRHCA